MADVAKLEVNGKTLEMPVTVGSEGEVAMDASKLRASTGAITMDWGYGNTGACESAITFINGEEGILRYRGYPIEQLCESSNYEEVSALLLNGSLPNQSDMQAFSKALSANYEVPDALANIFKAYPQGAHPMAMLSSAVEALAAYEPERDSREPAVIKQSMLKLMGQFTTLAAWCYRYQQGNGAPVPNNSLGYGANFLHMLFAKQGEDYQPHQDVLNALDVLLILHADHEQNCSTSTVRMVGSSEACLHGSIASGINALWGPLHGGANQAVLEMLENIRASGDDAKQFLTKVKDRSNAVRLMGFGHRVYKNFDPRARLIKSSVDKVLDLLGVNDPLLDIAKTMEETALQDSYFAERKLYPNVDFYSGILYRALGIPVNMFTVMFSIGRLPGWMAHWLEMHQSPQNRICRPRQIYTGNTERNYTPIAQR